MVLCIAVSLHGQILLRWTGFHLKQNLRIGDDTILLVLLEDFWPKKFELYFVLR